MEMEPQNPPAELEQTSDGVSEEKKTKKASKPRKTTKQTKLASEPQAEGSGNTNQAQMAQNTQLSPQDSAQNQEGVQDKPKRKRTKKTEDGSKPESNQSDSKAINSTIDSAMMQAGANEKSGAIEAVGTAKSIGASDAGPAGEIEKEKKPRKPRKSTSESGQLAVEGDVEKKPRKPRKAKSASEESNDSQKISSDKEKEQRELKEREERERKEREERERKEREERERKEREERERKEREERERKDREERERKEREERMRSDSFDASELRITRFPSYLLDRMDKRARNILTYSLNKLNGMNMKELGVCIDELNANKSFYDPQYSAERDLYYHIIKLIKYLEKRLKEEEEKNAQKFFRQEFIDPYHDGKFNKIIKKCNNDPANCAWEIVDKMGRKIQSFPYNEGVLRKWIEEYLRERLQKPAQ